MSHFKIISTSQLFLVNSHCRPTPYRDCFILFNENVILTTAATFKTQKKKKFIPGRVGE